MTPDRDYFIAHLILSLGAVAMAVCFAVRAMACVTG